MTRTELFEQIKLKRSFLCVGLDTDQNRIKGDVFEFNKRIIDATAPYTVAYKPNIAFYEAMGVDGIRAFAKTCAYIKSYYPEILVIVDAKRGDIGNTSELYAKAFLGSKLFDAVTLAPYVGADTVMPFLKYEGKWVVILALTSNASAADFELLRLENGKRLYEQVLETASQWGSADNTMFVVGATQASELANVRRIVPDHFLLVPGVGAQGGSLAEVARHGMNRQCGLLVNSSRGIIYAPDPAAEAQKMQFEMAGLLDELGVRG